MAIQRDLYHTDRVDESPPRRTDYEKVTMATEDGYPLQFCSHRWIHICFHEEGRLSGIISFRYPLGKRPGQGKAWDNKSWDVLQHSEDPFIPFRHQIFW